MKKQLPWGKGRWMLNNLLLEDNEYESEITNTIKELNEQIQDPFLR